ncbi:hypothetical protein D3C75_1151330 [compost metagenome]
MRGEGIGKQTAAVFEFGTASGLLARFIFTAVGVGVDLHFGVIDFGFGVEPILTHRFQFVAKLAVALNGRAIAHQVTAAAGRFLRVFRLLRPVVVVAQVAAQ